MRAHIATLTGALFLFGVVLLPVSTFAQETNEDVTAVEEVSVFEPTFDGVEVEVPEVVPGRFGIFWRGVKERASLLVTADPVVKAEKRLKFAQERILLAEKMAETGDTPEVQIRAEAMVERAKEMMAQVEERKDTWLERTESDERAVRLMKNLAVHEDRRERVMDRLEQVLPEESADRIRVHRDEMLEHSRRLMQAIENENIPQDVRVHLQEVKTRVEAHALEVRTFQEKHEALRGAALGGDEAAREELDRLREERHKQIDVREEVFQKEVEGRFEAVRKNLEQEAVLGDGEAELRLERLNEEKARFEQQAGARRGEVERIMKENGRELLDLQAPAAGVNAGEGRDARPEVRPVPDRVMVPDARMRGQGEVRVKEELPAQEVVDHRREDFLLKDRPELVPSEVKPALPRVENRPDAAQGRTLDVRPTESRTNQVEPSNQVEYPRNLRPEPQKAAPGGADRAPKAPVGQQ